MPAAATKMRQARRVAFVLGAIATLALAVAVFAGFRDSTNAHPADAAPIHETGVIASTHTEALDPPPNDNFDRPGYFATPFTFPGDSFSVSLPESTAGATLETGESAPCGPIGATVWFVFTADRPGTVVIDTAGSNFDTILSAYKLAAFLPSPPGGAGSLTPLACNDDSGGPQSRITMNVEPNVLYNLQVGGKNGATGTLQLHVACQPACAPPNDDFSATPYISQFQLPFTDVRDTTSATLEQGEQRPCGNIGATVWYEITPQQDVRIVVDTAGSDFNTVLAAYTLTAFVPSPPGGLALASCVDDPGGPLARIEFAAQANTAYYIQAGGAAGAAGMLHIGINCDPACPPPDQGFNTGQGGGCCVPTEPIPAPGVARIVTAPDTGSGGYLPGARR